MKAQHLPNHKTSFANNHYHQSAGKNIQELVSQGYKTQDSCLFQSTPRTFKFINESKGDKAFSEGLQCDLETLYNNSKHARQLIDNLEKSKVNIHIKNGAGLDSPNFTYDKFENDGRVDIQYERRPAYMHDGIVAYPDIILAHELVHALDLAEKRQEKILNYELIVSDKDGKMDPRKVQTISEIRAIVYTNKIREDFKISDLRSKHSKISKEPIVKITNHFGSISYKPADTDNYPMDILYHLFD